MIDIFPAESSEHALRLTLFDDEVETLSLFDPLTGHILQKVPRFTVYPSSHYVTPRATVLAALETIKVELRERIAFYQRENKLVEAQRIEQRTRFDLEMLNEMGFCKGIENYSRHLSGRKPGEPPPTLIDYLPPNALMFIDESHVTIPQIGGMYKGDRSRKENLVDYGFRLPSALDNRPLRFDEFEKVMRQSVFISATPSAYEAEHAGQVVEQVVRPTGLVDPQIEVRPATHQVDDLLSEVRLRVEKGERVLVTTLTKRMAEDLTDYLAEHGIKVRYLHSDIETVERVEIIRDLRLGMFDVLVGINLLREGLDIPEVSLVAILDADKEGFLRSERSLIQTIGRAARHLNGKAMLYADRITDSMRRAIDETERRRTKQVALQLRERHHPDRRAEAHQGHHRGHVRAGCRAQPAEGRAGTGEVPGDERKGSVQGNRPAGERHAASREEPGIRARRRTARPVEKTQGKRVSLAAVSICERRVATSNSPNSVSIPSNRLFRNK